jgi:hypothetical protein
MTATWRAIRSTLAQASGGASSFFAAASIAFAGSDSDIGQAFPKELDEAPEFLPRFVSDVGQLVDPAQRIPEQIRHRDQAEAVERVEQSRAQPQENKLRGRFDDFG